MDLDLDIRLQIYDELLVQGVHLHPPKCFLCSTRESRSINSTCVPDLVCTQILRTSKQIYSEAVERLYSRNTVQIQCRDCSKTDTAELWLSGVEPNNLPRADFDRHVKSIAIAYQAGSIEPYNWFGVFSGLWPGIEEQILARYENTKRISLRIQSEWASDTTYDLVRRSCNPPTERVQDYVNVLAQDKWSDKSYDAASESAALDEPCIAYVLLYASKTLRDRALAVLEEICDEVVLSNDQGDLKDTTFAVQRIRWKPALQVLKEFVLYLGCDKHSANNKLLESILAKRDSRQKEAAARFKALMDQANL